MNKDYDIIKNGIKLGPLEPYDHNNPEHNDPKKYVIEKKGTVLDHVLNALRSVKAEDYIINLAVLLHDIGKTKTHHQDENGLHRYFGHATKSAKMIDGIADRLKMSNDQKESLKFAALNHMKMHDLLKMKPAKVMRMMNDPNWDILMAVAEADVRARGELFDQAEWDKMIEYIDKLKDRAKSGSDVNSIRKLVNGKWVMDILGMTKGTAELGDVIKNTVDWVVNNNIDVKDIKTIKDKVLELGSNIKNAR